MFVFDFPQAKHMPYYADQVDSMDMRTLMITVIIASMIILFIKVQLRNIIKRFSILYSQI